MTSHQGARRLLLARHAKSAWPDLPDHERPLAPRGRRQAPLVGAWLRTHGYRPELVLCSTARRAVQTWELMAGELDISARVVSDERIYGAAGAALLELVRQAPPAVTTLLVVGHEPGIPGLAGALAGGAAASGTGAAARRRAGGGAGGALARMLAKFPTGAVAVLTVPGTWRDLEPAAAHLSGFVVPRDLER